MALKNRLTEAQKKKARKTPVHGAVSRAKNAIRDAAGVLNTKERETVSLREAFNRNKASFSADEAAARKAGFVKVKGRWVKPKKVVTSKGKGTAAVGPSGRSPSETKRSSPKPSKLTKKTKKRSTKVVKKARKAIKKQVNQPRPVKKTQSPTTKKSTANKRKNAIL